MTTSILYGGRDIFALAVVWITSELLAYTSRAPRITQVDKVYNQSEKTNYPITSRGGLARDAARFVHVGRARE